MDITAKFAHPDKQFQHLPIEHRDQGQVRRVRIKPSQDTQSPLSLELQFLNIRAENELEYGNETVTERMRQSKIASGDNRLGLQCVNIMYDKYDMYDRRIAKEGRMPGNTFIALSYTWGDEFPNHQVYIEHGDQRGWFSVRQNLFDFLITRRSVHRLSPWFWIDQICIDQTNIAEKGHQVNQMSLIYTMANNVEIWLGPTIEGSRGAIHLIRSSAARLAIDPKRSHHRTRLTYLQRVLDLPYWSRLWIVQEVRLGMIERAVIVRLGQETFTWREWQRAFKAFYDFEVSNLPACLTKESLDRIRPLLQSDLTPRNWYNVHHLVAGRDCSNIRDKVFGVLSLVDERLRFYPGYSKTTEELLLQILNTQLRSDQEEGRACVNYVSTALEWLQILDESHIQIDVSLVRKWLLQEAHRHTRHLCKVRKGIDHSNWYDPKRLIDGMQAGPEILTRMRLRWTFPEKGSLRWQYSWLRNGPRNPSGSEDHTELDVFQSLIVMPLLLPMSLFGLVPLLTKVDKTPVSELRASKPRSREVNLDLTQPQNTRSKFTQEARHTQVEQAQSNTGCGVGT